MRQMIFGGAVAAPVAGTTIDKLSPGAVGFYYLKDGVETLDLTGEKLAEYGSIALGRSSKDGGPVVLPFYNKCFSYSKGVYSPATTFSAKFTVADVTIMSDHSVIFVKKGSKFNERANWTATVHVFNSSKTAVNVAEDIAKYVNNNSENLGLTAVATSGEVVVTGTKAGVDYEIIPADALYGTEITYTTRGIIGNCDAEAVKKFADMAAADVGFNDTYQDSVNFLYPNYPFNPLTQPEKEDIGFTVYTLRFAVPRATKTVDELVHQIVQIIIPYKSADTEAEQVATLDKILAKIAEK